MNYLDAYDENGKFLGRKSITYIYENGLWHNTIDCLFYDKNGYVFFQIRRNDKKLYPTASGNVLAGESIKETFVRKIKESLGIDVDYEKSTCIQIIPYKLDIIKKDGNIFKDRILDNFYILEFNGSYENFNFNLNEVSGLVKLNIHELLDLFLKEKRFIKGEVIKFDFDKIICDKVKIIINDFVVTGSETLLDKYGLVLNRIISDKRI